MTDVRVAVDLGKTGCRAVLLVDGQIRAEASGEGAVGLAAHRGAQSAYAAVTGVVAAAQEQLAGARVAAAFIGAAGVATNRVGTGSLARELGRHWGVDDVGVGSDAVTGHAGALGGEAGAVLTVGTGAVAFGLADDGRSSRVDGWGQWLGDDGSGSWIGQQALRQALRHHDGRSVTPIGSSLAAAAEARFGDLSLLPSLLGFDGDLPRATAAFVPDVLACADAGDEAARDILARAVDLWVESTVVAARALEVHRVALVGGLSGVAALRESWVDRLPGDLDPVAHPGTSLDGARLLLDRRDLPHERLVSRLAGQDPSHDPGHGSGHEPGHDSGHDPSMAHPIRGVRPMQTDDVDRLATEAVRPDLEDLDERDAAGIVDLLVGAEAGVPALLDAARPSLTTLAIQAERAVGGGGRLVYVGAGTPGRLAALDAAECPPTFGIDPGQVVAVLAGGLDAQGRALEGVEDDSEAGARDMVAIEVGPADLVVGITASGRTPYVLAALATAGAAGAQTAAIVNNADSQVKDLVPLIVELPTGPEVIAGSTRLTAGTAQKIALNVVSTTAMVRLGKTYGARMVDVVASNDKLRRRAVRIVVEVAGVDDEAAHDALAAADWHTTAALVALLAGIDAVSARARLDAAGGRVRQALLLTDLPSTGPGPTGQGSTGPSGDT